MVGATRTTLSIGILTEDTSATTVMDMRIGMDTRRTPDWMRIAVRKPEVTDQLLAGLRGFC